MFFFFIRDPPPPTPSATSPKKQQKRLAGRRLRLWKSSRGLRRGELFYLLGIDHFNISIIPFWFNISNHLNFLLLYIGASTKTRTFSMYSVLRCQGREWTRGLCHWAGKLERNNLKNYLTAFSDFYV